MPDCFPAKNRAARSLEMPEPSTHPSAGQASPLLSTLPPSPQPLSHPLWAAVLPAGQNRLLIRWGQLAALHNTCSQVQVQVTSTSTSPVSVQVVSWQLFTILSPKYKCCLSDSQLIKEASHPKILVNAEILKWDLIIDKSCKQYMEQQEFVICKQKSGSTEKMQINWCGLVNAVLPFHVYVFVLYNIISVKCVIISSYKVSGRTGNKTATI